MVTALLIILALVAFASAQEVLVRVSVSADGVDQVMTLFRGESPLQAAARFVQEAGLGVAVDPTGNATPMTVQLAEVLLQRLNQKQQEDAQRQQQQAQAPLASFPVVRDDGVEATFEHYEGQDMALEAQAFCQGNIAQMELGACVGQIVNGAQQVMQQRQREEQAQRQTQRKIVMETEININGQMMALSVAEGENSNIASDYFCRSLDLDQPNYAICLSSVVPIVEQRIKDFMAAQQQRANEPPLFEIPIQIGDKVMPLAFSLSENPSLTTRRFCDAQWSYIETVLKSNNGEGPTKDLCVNTLFSTVSGMLDELLQSSEGQALVDSQKLFTISVELTPEGQSSVGPRLLNLNVFPDQTPEVAVTEFLRTTGIGEEAKPALIEMVTNRLARA
mmetsp:Transcript_10554/g.19119  ORF Transcript_10554/g.19119 Transcript_10554/m.19119 type:complete len:391 (+) Transcript_10554:62-1234(+)|eukprot:CAMPEP_0182501958 /NCGR_PEP_ID=MMETSP1321-20130603/12427_1 /TAXON_ID=91990 /ORGANISM="Bolidomonas sp., Strain RCC1657" /LENGTH=390 /DNA_ID=CAMNT_0024706735 /DNA_START=28 /DNA_END=1200 /DNA_ORIENTATION=+